MKRNIQFDAPIAAYESITVGAAAVGFTAATYASKQGAFITIENTNIRWRADGTSPTATEGHLAAAGGSLRFMHPSLLSDFKAISTGGNAVLKVSYY